MKKNDIREGIISGLPIVIGYIPIGMAFGILSKTVGIKVMDSLLISIMVFAGASQFMAINLLAIGVGVWEIIFTTLLVNFRHFLMSASIGARLSKEKNIERMDNTNKIIKWAPLMAFGITDESFSVMSFREGKLSIEYILSLQLVAYLSWVSGTGIGYMVGGILPTTIQESMGIALYSMFIALLIPEAKKSKKVIILAILSGILNTILQHIIHLSQGWSVIIAIIIVSYLGIYLFNEEVEVRLNE